MWIVCILLLLPWWHQSHGQAAGLRPTPPLPALTPVDGLSDKTVFSICQDRRGFMWFGTLNGLNRYDGYEIKNYYHRDDDTTSLGANCVRDIFEDRQGTLWIGTWGGGVSRYQPDRDRFSSYDTHNSSLGSDSVTCLFEDRDHQLWLGTMGGGLYRCLPEQDDFEPLNDSQHLSARSRALAFLLAYPG